MMKFIKRILRIILPDKIYLKIQFKRRLGYKLSLKNPKTYNEKIQWLKIYNISELHIICADKYKVRDFIKQSIGDKYLIPLLFHTKNPEEINPKNIHTFPAIIKPNHLSGQYHIIKNIDHANWDKIRSNCSKWLKSNYYWHTRERQYKTISQRIIVEKLLTDSNGKIPTDYKIHCFNGKVDFIQVDQNRETKLVRNNYDLHWEQLPFTWLHEYGNTIPKPECFNEMVQISEKLSSEFIYVRVDLYVLDNKIYFGELTFHPGSGYKKFKPKIWDKILGEKIKLPSDK